MLVACVTASGTVTGVWPVVELHRLRVSPRLATEPTAGTLERSAWRELEGGRGSSAASWSPRDL